MAMNKTEKHLMEKLQQELRRARAWRQTEPVKPDVSPPMSGQNKLTTGFVYWVYNLEASIRVACSTAFSHGVDRTDKADCQNPRHLYSSRLLALKAARYDVEQQAITALAYIDRQIKAQQLAELEEDDIQDA